MIRQPPDVVIVSARRRGRGHGGWSRNNPYLEEVCIQIAVSRLFGDRALTVPLLAFHVAHSSISYGISTLIPAALCGV